MGVGWATDEIARGVKPAGGGWRTWGVCPRGTEGGAVGGGGEGWVWTANPPPPPPPLLPFPNHASPILLPAQPTEVGVETP